MFSAALLAQRIVIANRSADDIVASNNIAPQYRASIQPMALEQRWPLPPLSPWDWTPAQLYVRAM